MTSQNAPQLLVSKKCDLADLKSIGPNFHRIVIADVSWRPLGARSRPQTFRHLFLRSGKGRLSKIPEEASTFVSRIPRAHEFHLLSLTAAAVLYSGFLPRHRQGGSGAIGATAGVAAAELLGRLIQYTTACAGRKITRPFFVGCLLVPLALPRLPFPSCLEWEAASRPVS